MKAYTSLNEYWKLSQTQRNTAYVTEDIVVKYPIKDQGEPLVNLNTEFTKANLQFFYTPPEDIAAMVPEVRVRKTVAQRLVKAAKKIAEEGLLFRISEGYRPLSYQRQIFQEVFSDFQKKHPTKTHEEIWHLTTQYVADPDLCPPHSTGGAVDLTLTNKNGVDIDMGIPMNHVGELSNTFVKGLSAKHRKNRLLLFDSLLSVGFSNLVTEWWHFSYGDQYWAIYYKKPHALYNSVLK